MESLDPDPVPDPTPVEEVKPAPPKLSRSADISLIIAFILLGAAGLFFLIRGVWDFVTPDRTSTLRQVEPPRVVSRLDYGSGRNDTIGEEFTVPRGCTKVILHFEGEQLDKDVDVAFVDFDIYDRENNDYAADNSGPHRLEPTGQGSDSLRLQPNVTYFVETSAYNATWSYRINCE